MGATDSKPTTTTVETTKSDEIFKEDVRKAAGQFKDLVQRNKVMIFSTTYCSYCTVAKKILEDVGTRYNSYEVNKEAEEGQMMMNIVSSVTGNRMVPAIFICGQLVPGGAGGLKHLATSGQLTSVLAECCGGDHTCSDYDQYNLR